MATGLSLLRETKESVIVGRMKQKAGDLRESDASPPPKRHHSLVRSAVDFLRKSLFRPLHMLFTEMVVGPICIYAGFNFGLLYALVVVLPDIFLLIYDFDYTQRALSFLGLIIGCLLGPPLLLLDDKIIRRQEALYRETSGDDTRQPRGLRREPENRLRGAMFGGICLPVGLFWFAWTARPDISYFSPIIASTLITLGGLCVYVSTSSYIIEVYGPKYSASANAASSMVRYAMAGVVPLFVLPMYNALKVDWATSLLGFATVFLMPIPWIFSRWGPALRRRCKYEMEWQDAEPGS